ncbi:hypothetical protein GCM10009039_26250 [Halocalculus aciditolerans]|uniref:Uncharacterized protein n=1 Tax=Halocalculus aciditolerans TaxID=1383812 RepID=A0A830FLB8_9EURY|nr:hypothetical protein [Halocalculus aciditolerans]GGL67003.1 hypothetical protein GCM10009039_26250 [Halocalculus aciditolerans]
MHNQYSDLEELRPTGEASHIPNESLNDGCEGAPPAVTRRGEPPSADEAEPAVDDYTLIYDLDEAPARQLVEQWPSLLDAVQVLSGEGERLLSAARDRPEWIGQGASGAGPDAALRPAGDGIRDASRLDAVLGDADDAVWLVPAMALAESTGEAAADR